MALRDKKGRFLGVKKKKTNTSPSRRKKTTYEGDHDYLSGLSDHCCPPQINIDLGNNVDRIGWREGRRIVEFDVLLSSLKTCKFCKLGPVPLIIYNIVGELKKGLGGYLYVKCMNPECEQINCAPYGKTHRQKKKGMPCFVANTKLCTSMIDSIEGQTG
ncbi:uncharacterized protein LOC134259786 [Saccostrea cucullata]|uniref:uncharacterized protein LOC134259786 n=1 Tax=Saccostrea cuccullata TaxID=36930 RepID=UPI002ED4ECBB